MITQALRHCSGIGAVKLAQLQAAGICSWQDVMDQAAQIPAGVRDRVLEEAQRSQAALESQDIGYFVDRLHPSDKWRVLTEYFDQTSFFDIETSGLEIDAVVTVIVCWHRGQLHTFVEHENLDEFLELMDDMSLLASFNGASFDVPRVLDAFHIPQLPCPHLDLRWPCYHAGLTGGLKTIEQQLQLTRPADLECTDGEQAVLLWERWLQDQNRAARDELLRYCAADVLMLVVLAQHLARLPRQDVTELWAHLPPVQSRSSERAAVGHKDLVSELFGKASPAKLRMRRRAAG